MSVVFEQPKPKEGKGNAPINIGNSYCNAIYDVNGFCYVLYVSNFTIKEK